MAPRGGRRGGRPGRQNRPSENKNTNRLCLQFQKGKCNFGEKCKFSHDIAGAANERPSHSSGAQLDPEARAEYYEWKRLLREDPYYLHGSDQIEDALKLWQGALTILKGDSQDQHHIVAKELVDDKFNGPAWIRATARMTSFRAGLNFDCAEAFLRVISHPSLAPLSISPFIGTIYTLFGGTSGEQGIEFLSRMCPKLKWNTGALSRTLDPEVCGVVDVTLKVLNDLLMKTIRVRFCDRLPNLIESLDDLIAEISRHLSGAFCDGLRGRLDIKRIIAGSTARIATPKPSTDKKANKKSVASSFPQEIAIPGGRHDNDFADISDISILPTQGEITSEHTEYLPSTNFLHPHVLEDPMQRYIDSTFRLVRHDALGPVNDVLRDVLSCDNLSISRTSEKNSQAQVYTSSKLRHISVPEKGGLEAIVSFLAPPFIRKKSAAEQRDWWQRSPRLGEGTLVCFVIPGTELQRPLFLQVTSKNSQWSRERPDISKSSLVSHNSAPSITVKLATRQESDLALLIRLFRNNTIGVLVGFNGVIPDTFMPILKNLQQIQSENHIAFQKWILPAPNGNNHMLPPLYARKPGFSFLLGCIAKDRNSQLKLDPSLALRDINLKEIEKATGLDHGQCLGLVGALTSEYALIQGPPGTGKSYVGVQLVRTLLAVKEHAKLGPILIICYTNHALDQFLKHLLDVGMEAIIRIGGCSVEEKLDSKNLRVVSKETQKTGVERCILGEAYSKRESSLESANIALRPLFQTRKGPTWSGLQRYLSRKHTKIHNQLKSFDEDGFEMVTKDPLKTWLRARPKQITIEPSACRAIIRRAERDVNSLSYEERWFIAEYWLEQQYQDQLGLLFESLEDAEEQRETVQRTHDAVDQRALARADVIGITTTSLAKQFNMLRSLKIKCVMCEEAGELREADIISALMQDVEHFIQIGDHKQLRPQINNFELSLESSSGKFWQLDRSQFERRAVGEPGLAAAPFAQLNVQRRMRPEISQLIRRVYPNLQDHESTFTLPDVVGMRKTLFWLDHNHPEDSGGDGTRVKSHSNQWETNMATALVRHIVRQVEYRTEDIALLTPYTGQLQKLRAALGKDFEICLSDRDMDQLAQEGFEDESGPHPGTQKMIEKKQLLQTIRLATVDNFQGEEAKVIIVSLVRSNTQRKVGFLRTENRINVLLSRAQHGMYLIGNSETYLNTPMWADVYNQLSQAGSVGKEIDLCCPRHKNTNITCAEPEDFEIKSPEGGCTLTFVGKKIDLLLMEHVLEFVIDLSVLVTTGALRVAMMGVLVIAATHHVRLNARTLHVTRRAARHVLRALRHVFGPVHTSRRAQCPAQHHVIDSLVTNDAQKNLPVAINAQASAERIALPGTVKNAVAKTMLELIFWMVLGCGHFFTGETLDGLVGLDEVYTRNKEGAFDGLKDVTGSLSRNVPFRPDCKRPIRQFATKRYNRLINRAVMDEIYKRFIINGREALNDLEGRLQAEENKLNSSRTSLSSISSNKQYAFLKGRYKELKKLKGTARVLANRMGKDHQPTKLLLDSIATARFKATGDPLSLALQMETLKLSPPEPDKQIILGANLITAKAEELQLQDSISLLQGRERTVSGSLLQLWLKEQPLLSTDRFFTFCHSLIDEAKTANLPRTMASASLCYAKVSQLATWRVQTNDGAAASNPGDHSTKKYYNRAKAFLTEAKFHCEKVGNSDMLKERIREMLRLFEPQYNNVTPEELASIKSAMVCGRQGINTHSGHWYNCENGHPFAIGECGMPMEVARCPECGARIGGTNHAALEGVTRAEDMERP
ncbi:hypothetical protein F53441_353 [Fusarium austroafricanum]|uniref:C3H1-type domain-containing protein n=1 Tax=Fusarium austroafricanum TaxID=2364996 RepID=A0A8H4KUM0_9HYPO|nr:hypothetical protein F53441_353 [Fusarium austroafricanum]